MVFFFFKQKTAYEMRISDWRDVCSSDLTDGALSTLQAMHDRHPHNAQTLRQLQRLHQQRGDWSAVVRLLPELRKDKVLPPAELADLECRAWGENLSLAAHRDADGSVGLQSHNRVWQQPNGSGSWRERVCQ